MIASRWGAAAIADIVRDLFNKQSMSPRPRFFASSDFDFPAMSDPSKVPPGWLPGIVDYLFIGFTTTTSLSPQATPLFTRAKSLVSAQSLISLVTIDVVASRAIGIT
jgi:hypothetical protein